MGGVLSTRIDVDDGMRKKVGLTARRIGFCTNFDLEDPKSFPKFLSLGTVDRPSKIWLSLPCTPCTLLQNANQRTHKQISCLSKKKGISKLVIKSIFEQVIVPMLKEDDKLDIF